MISSIMHLHSIIIPPKELKETGKKKTQDPTNEWTKGAKVNSTLFYMLDSTYIYTATGIQTKRPLDTL